MGSHDRKTAADLLTYALSLGFVLHRYTARGHVVLRHPTHGTQISYGYTATGSSRTETNIRAQLRAAARAPQ